MSSGASQKSLIFATTSTTCTTTMTRPIASPVPSPPLSPKRKVFFDDDCQDAVHLQKRRRTRPQASIPLYRNFGNGLSLCNNTMTYRMDFDDVVDVLRRSLCEYDGRSMTDAIDVEELRDDVLEEFLADMKEAETKELPELHLSYADLREDLITTELDFVV